MQTLEAASTVLGLLHNVKKTYEVVQDLLRQSEDNEERAQASGTMAEAMALTSGLQRPLFLCMELQNRQETSGYVSSPVWFTRRVLQRFEALSTKLEASLEEDDLEDEDYNNGGEKGGDKNGNGSTSRQQQQQQDEDGSQAEMLFESDLAEIVEDLKTCVNLLNLALTSVHLVHGQWRPSQPIASSFEASQVAQDFCRRFETEQTQRARIASGEVYEWRVASVSRKSSRQKDLVCLGLGAVWLQREPNDTGLTLEIQIQDSGFGLEAGDADLANGSSSGHSNKVDQIRLILDRNAGFLLKQERKGDIDEGALLGSLLMDRELEYHQIAYEIRGKTDDLQPVRTFHLVFEAFGKLSCQAFEEILRTFAHKGTVTDEKDGVESPSGVATIKLESLNLDAAE
ncbi:Hypothetical Protein FCC1311_058272 [Hondaea fermentalgiana]|uniref:Uncharacterized protein n=1 Tax=Hondaea fermentalgiana TaxID=2315210 RepID=A0A2R5GF97_9STRA|nr:Hypothetical Protein FCC1311_058272 [Hondaea fermentalgiana]|eukprot:GBG29606.1 Hypothetical Protein FCC1311_058272 [Hondaea fermentalgiana]